MVGFRKNGDNVISDQYAAGFFDGEGSVYAAMRSWNRRTSSPTILVCIGNTNKAVLELHRDRWGGSLLERGGKHLARVASGKYQRQFQWVLAPRMATVYLRSIAPHLIIKKEVVATALDYLRIVGLPRCEKIDYSHTVERRGRKWVSPMTRPEIKEELIALHAKIRELNAGSAPGNVRRVSQRLNATMIA